ncbi:MAG: zinc-ribbon domain-containing protein, partial [Candidatus Hodarchaeales archaeon]
MTYCPICGTKNIDNHQFCIKCGASLGGPEGKMPKVTSFEAREPKPGMLPPVTRAYWVWLLLMILLSGIFNYIYLYLNFEDLNRVDAFKPVQQEGPSLFTKKGTVLAFVILSAVIPVLPIFHCILIYWKYQKLNRYLNAQVGKQHSVPNSAGARLTLLIFQYLFSYGALAVYIVMMVELEISLFDFTTYDDLYL